MVIAPSGEIIHVSALFEGSISDKELVKRSGLFPLLEPGDQLMTDKGFDIKDILEPIGCEITIPAFLSSKEDSFQKKNFCTVRKFTMFMSMWKELFEGLKSFTFWIMLYL